MIGLTTAWRRSPRGQKPWFLLIGIVGILLLSLNAAAWLISLPLEFWYPHSPFPPESADALVILSGTIPKPSTNRPYTFPGQDTNERLQHGLWLFKHWKSIPILVSGGALAKQEPYAATMKRVLESEGVPPDLIWVEDRSRSTHENAVFSSTVLRQHGVSRVALVVEANSMPRAAAAFRKAGITVVPAPIRFVEPNYDVTDIIPNWRAISLNDEAFHEYLGLLWYRLRGWI